MVVVLPVCVAIFWPAGSPRWSLMWGIAFAFYFGFKWLTWRRTNAATSSAGRQVAYLAAWPGMDADAFLNAGRTVSPPSCLKFLLQAPTYSADCGSSSIRWTGSNNRRHVDHCIRCHLRELLRRTCRRKSPRASRLRLHRDLLGRPIMSASHLRRETTFDSLDIQTRLSHAHCCVY